MSSPVIFKGKTYQTITALANELGKTHNQIYSHLKKGTEIIGTGGFVDYKISQEEIDKYLNSNKL